MISATIRNAIHAWVTTASGLAAGQVIWAQQKGDLPSGAYITLFLPGTAGVGHDSLDTKDNPITVADDDIDTVDFANNELDVAAHTYTTGMGPFRLSTTGTLPTGLSATIDYWIVVVNAGTIQLADTFQKAIAAVPTVVAFSDAGSGTHTIEDTPTTTAAGEEIKHTVRGPRTALLEIRYFADTSDAVAAGVTVLEAVKSKCRLPSISDALVTAKIGIGSFSAITSVPQLINKAVFQPRHQLDVTLHLASEQSETGTFIEKVITVNDPPFA